MGMGLAPRKLRAIAVLSAVAMFVSACMSAGVTATPAATSAPSPTVATTPSMAAPSMAAPSPTASLLAVDCSQAHFIKPGTLIVAVHGTGLPDIIVNADGSLGALVGTLLNPFAKDCNLKIELYQSTLASSVLAVQDHKADLVANIYYTPARSKVVYFMYPHDIADHFIVYYRSDFNYTGPSSCTNIATLVGSAVASYLQSFNSGLLSFPSDALGFTAVGNKQTDCWVTAFQPQGFGPLGIDPAKFAHTQLNGGEFGIPSVVLAPLEEIAVACDNKPLADVLNAELTNLVNTGVWAPAMTAQGLDPTTSGAQLTSPQQGC